MPRKIKCILLEDDPIQLRLLRLFCEDHLEDYCNVVATFTGSDKFIENEKKYEYDLLMLDIDMPGAKGTDIARLVSKPVVFVTGRDGYEREVLDLQFSQDNIITLIRKPVDKDKVEKAFKKYLQQLSKSESGVFDTADGKRNIDFKEILLITTKSDGFKKGILAKSKIEEKLDPRNKIMVTTNGILKLKFTEFDELLEKLPASDFFQVNKWAIAGRRAIDNYSSDGLTYKSPLNQFIAESYFNVSAGQQKDFKSWYSSY